MFLPFILLSHILFVFFIIMIIQVNLREWDLEFHDGINLALVILKELKLMIIVKSHLKTLHQSN